jgi:rod shape-determining protein MreD
MQWLRFAALVLVTVLLQVNFTGLLDFTGLGIRPDLLLILVVFFGTFASSYDGIISSFILGLSADLIGPAMGPQTLSFGILGSLLAWANRALTVRKMPLQSLTIFVMAVLTGVLTRLLAHLRGPAAPAWSWYILFGTAVYSAVLGPFIFIPAAWWMRIRKDRFRR